MVDPRTPVIIGVGQVNVPESSAEPAELLTEAARRAAIDSGSTRVLSSLQSIRVMKMLSRRYPDPGRLVAKRLGIDVGESIYTTDGGQHPQLLVARTAREIQDGQLDIALIGGAEAWRTRTSAKAAGRTLSWSQQSATEVPTEVVGQPIAMTTPYETSLGLTDPVQFYPMVETALRARFGRSVEAHDEHLGRLWARFSAVAATNPYAAVPEPRSADEILDTSGGNRMIGYPYRKIMNANSSVNQAAAIIMCSEEHARSLGVPRDRWVFPLSIAYADDVQYLSHRRDLDRSPAIRHTGRKAFELARMSIDDVSIIDLYSCFPSAVQVAANELGIALDGPLTVTGGLSFAGGPFNNYVCHAIATIVELLRESPAEVALCSANGGLLQKHAIGIYSGRPSNRCRVAAAAPEADIGGSRPFAENFRGSGTLEAFTVMHDRENRPVRAFATLLTADGVRALATSEQPEISDALLAADLVGSNAIVSDGELLEVG